MEAIFLILITLLLSARNIRIHRLLYLIQWLHICFRLIQILYTQTTLPHIKAIFAFNNPNSVTPVITLKINGSSVTPVLPVIMTQLKKLLDYALSRRSVKYRFKYDISRNKYWILPQVLKSTKINVEPDPKFNLLTEDMIYKKPNILIYGKILTKQITGVVINFNGIDYNTMPDSLGNFIYPVTLKKIQIMLTLQLIQPMVLNQNPRFCITCPITSPLLLYQIQLTEGQLSLTANAISPGGYSIINLISGIRIPETLHRFHSVMLPHRVFSINIPVDTGEYILKLR